MQRKRLLIIGCGDVALRAAKILQGRYRLFGLVRHADKAAELRSLGIVPIIGDLDKPVTLRRLAGIAELVLHTAPPPADGRKDSRTVNLLSRLGGRCMVPQRLVYISTSGVYGDCHGELVPETRPANPRSARAIRRVDAEQQLRRWARHNGVNVNLLRAPGIYAHNRLPLQRLRAATPVLLAGEDSFTNHIHADDLARIAIAALHRGRPGRSYNAADDSHLKMGDYFDLLADHFRIPRPPRVSLSAARAQLPASLLSFMEESRRLTNVRVRKELRVRLTYPTAQSVLDTIADGKAVA